MKKFMSNRRLVAACLLLTFMNYGVSVPALAADISVGGPLPTDTNINVSGNITDISTMTAVNGGKTGINSFNRFNVNQGDIVNLNLINSQNKLVNLIFDNSPSQINGIVNSYMGSNIGGNVLFANPHGFVVGQSGVFNVGSLTLMTPTEKSMEDLINTNILGKAESYNDEKVERLVGFSFNDQNYLINSNKYEPVELAPGQIEIAGKINSGKGIDLISGSGVSLLPGSELNANMVFSTENGTLSVVPGQKLQGAATNSYPKKLAMQDGNGIVIVASNNNASQDVLSAIVNMEGKVSANGGDVIARSEIFQTDKSGDAKSQINVKSGADIDGNNVLMSAVSKVSSTDKNIVGVTDLSKEQYYGYLGEAANFVVNEFVHLANVDTSVNIESGARINAENNVSLNSLSDMDISSGALLGTLPNINLNFTSLTSKTNTSVKNGSTINAKNLTVDAVTNLELDTTAKSTNIVDRVTGKEPGSYALGITTTNLQNKAIIENGAALTIKDNIDVLARTTSYHKDTVKNGLVPVLDKNHGPVGAAMSFIKTDITNEAIMNANTNLTGKLTVDADYEGKVSSTVYGYSGTGTSTSGGTAENGFLDNLLLHFKSQQNINEVISRSNAKYNKIDTAGAVGIIIDNVNSTAKIGDLENGIKPSISASQVQLKSTATDYKSNLYAQAESEQGATAASGALAVNYKNLTSDAKAYGDFTLSGSNQNTIYTTAPSNEYANDGNFYKQKDNNILLTTEQYNKLDNEAKKDCTKLEKEVKVYWYKDGDNIVYTDSADKKVTYTKVNGITYVNGENYISQAEYNKLSDSEKLTYTQVTEPLYFYLSDGKSADALSITSNTEIIHPMAWIDWFQTFAPFFKGETWSQAGQEVADHWNSIETNNASDYLSKLGALGELTHIMDEGGFDIFNTIDFNNVGAYGFFNTFAQSKASAKAQQGDTKALAGAIGIALFNANANAILDNNSTVVLQNTNPQKSGITVSANSENQIWTASTLMNLLNATSVLAGGAARDGSAYGVSGAFSYSDSNVIARIGENVNILNDKLITNSALGDVNVKASEDGNFLTLSAGSSSPDNTGLSGSIGMTVLGNGIVKAAIDSGASVFANNVNVEATKDDNFVNAIISFANGQNAYGFGLSGIVLTDSVESYIAGNVNALNTINIKADYDKLIVNANANIGVAKAGTDDPVGDTHIAEDDMEDYYGFRLLFDDSASDLNWYNIIKKYKAKSQRIDEIVRRVDEGFDYTRALNPDKKTKSNAGGINLNLALNNVKAYVKDGANLTSGKDVKVNAGSSDLIIDTNAVVSANGKSGNGATIMADISSNTIEASIGNAVVNANNLIEVKAGEEYSLIAASAGVAAAKDSAGAGNVSSAVQVNNVTAAIKDGAKINETSEGENQSVKVEGSVDSQVIKAVGAVAVQYGGGDSAKGAVGGTIDGDVVNNTINAYIKGADVNAVKSIDVNGINEDRLILVDVAGSASPQNSAYAGTIGAYVAVNDINSYIENANINTKTFTTANRPNQDVNLKATSKFNEIDVVGTGAGGDKTGVGASARVDAVVNDVNSYIKNSVVNSQGDAVLTNSDSMSQISVAVAGAGSTHQSAGAGVISVLADVTSQNNYIENSTLNVGSLTLDTDKVIDTISVTGVVSAALGGTSVGLSAYALGASHDINTYIKNSNVTSTGDIRLTSDFNQDATSIIFGGAGGKGFAGSGAISVLVNDSNINTYVLAQNGSDKKNLISTDGAIQIHSENDLDTVTVDGNVGISTGGGAAGAAVNTTVYNSHITSGIDGANVQGKKGVDILAKANQKHISTAVGASVGTSVGVEGSIDTVVMNQDINAYIKNAEVETSEGDVIVEGSNSLKIDSGVGAVAGSTSGVAVGGSVDTLVINQAIASEIVNSTLNALKGSVKNSSKSNVNILSTLLGFGGSSSTAINGSVGTQVFNIDTKSEIKNSTLTVSNEVLNESYNQNDVDTYVATANGAGTAAIGGVVYSIVDNSTSQALINCSTTINNARILNNTATMLSDYIGVLFNASGSGEAAVNGTVSTYVLNSQANSIIDGALISNAGDINVKSDNNSNSLVVMLQASGSGEAAVNGGVNTFVSSKKSKAQVNNSTITSNGNVSIDANGDNKIDLTVVGGAGSGVAAVTGSVNTIVSSDEIKANVSNSSVSTTVANNSSKDNGITVKASDNLTVTGHTGSAAGSGGAAVGGAIVTGVITNSVEAFVNNSDLISNNADVIVTSAAKETLGDSKNPFITIAAAGSGGAGVSGAVDTLVVNSSSVSKVSGKKSTGVFAGDKLVIKGEGDTDLLLSVGVGAGGAAGVGGTVSTVIIDKEIQAVADNTVIKSLRTDIDALSIDNITNIIVAGSIGTTAGVTGAVNTTVINSDLTAGISNSRVNSNNIDINSFANANYENTTGAVAGGGVAGVGASVVTNVVGYNSSAYLKDATVRGFDETSRANNINVDSTINNNYDLYAISGALAGTAGVGGVVETNVVNNTLSAFVTGDIYSDNLTVKSKDTANFNGIAGTLAGGLAAGVGATIQTNSVTSTVLSYIGGSDINVNDIEVKSEGVQNFNDLAVIGFGGGSVGVNGSSLANIVDATVKSYVLKNSTITSGRDLDVIANNTTNITETIGTGAAGKYAAVAASVGVNKLSNTTEAFTQENVTLNAKDVDFNAKTVTNLGKEGNNLSLTAGSVAAGGSLAGSVLVNYVENKTAAYLGGNNSLNNLSTLNLNAQDDTSIYETVGAYGVAGVVGIGASVGVNTINNTVISSIGSGSTLNMTGGDVSLSAVSNEVIKANANVVGGGGIALSGGVLHNTIGKNVLNAPSNDLTGDDAQSYNSAKSQADEVLAVSNNHKKEADLTFKQYYNNASSDVAGAISDANNNVNSSLADANSGASVEISANNVAQKPSTFSLFTKSDKSGSSLGSTDRNNTTSAFVDTGVKISAKDVTVHAKDNNNVTINVDGDTYGAAAIGVAAAVSNVNTTTNAFLSNNVVINSTGNVDINAESVDNQNLTVSAASGGIISGSGAVSKVNSNKVTNTYILNNSLIDAGKDLNVASKSVGVINSKVTSGSYGGVTVGVSVADAIIKGETKVDVSENVTLNSRNGNITIKTDEDEKATADASAASGSLAGGSGAEVLSQAGKTNTVNIGKNVNIFAKLAALISSKAKNEVIAETNGRAYGGVSAGGTKTIAKIEHSGGVNISDADKNSNKGISGKSVNISSTAENNADAKTKAGAGAAVGVSGSGVYTNINSNNNVYVGKNYNVNTTDGAYIVAANNTNTYKAFNDSSAYGAVGVSAGIIENNINSTVNAVSNSNVAANGQIEIFANNQVKKDAVSNYDLFGGAGGVVGVGSASLTDNIVMATKSELGGDYAYSTGKFNSGYINVSSQSILNVNEKVDVTAGGAIPVADGNVRVKSDVTTQTNILNKDIKTLDDDIYYLANSDIDIYTKSNVASYGGIAVADGESAARNNSSTTSVNVKSGVKSVSGRDTFIQSVADKNIQAYMYAVTQGLIGAVGDSQATAYSNSKSEISIESNSDLKAYDSMNLTALDSTSKHIAKRDAKGTTYIVFGIPITIYGKGHENNDNTSNASITLNGALESGLGANKKLVIKSNGEIDEAQSNGIHVIGKEKVGEITSSDIDSDMEAYENSRKGALQQLDDYVAVENNIITEAQAKIQEYTTKQAELQQVNETYGNAVDNANTIIAINDVSNAWNSAYSVTTETDPETGTVTTIYSLDSSFGTTLNGYTGEDNMASVISAYNTYNADKSDINLAALKSCVDMLSGTKDAISGTITDINSGVDCSDNNQLGSFITTTQSTIQANNETITNYGTSIVSLNQSIDTANNSINLANNLKQEINVKYDEIIAELQKQKDEASISAIPVYSLMIDDIYVRSGDTNITGNVTGNGSITAPGNKFTIDIVNNSVNDVVYKDIQIGRNVTGVIHGSNIADTISKTILNNNPEYTISIKNTVDANDPTINLSNGFGDMVFRGNVENVKGLVSFVNNTGNVLSDGSITAKDLQISVPNGAYTQRYDTTTVKPGGESGAGAIIASGDINIASKVIDINGLIQSGSEIKSVTIPEFKVVKEGDTYYQVVNGVKTAMEKGSTDGYYYLNLDNNGQLDADLEMIKAYFKPSDTSNAGDIKGDIHLFKAEIQGGDVTLTGNIISSSNSGKIVLVNGYGHIDVVNNSGFNLVTSALNADANIQGKLTINDFKLSDTDKAGAAFDNLTQSQIENKNWLSQNAGTYTAQVGKDGKITTTSTGQTTGNGSWGGQSSSVRGDGANVNTIMYNPGDDAYIVTKAGSVETKSYQEYVKRSWWTELWHGKLYRTVYYDVIHDPEYGVAKNSVQVQFQGFDTPQINVTSNGAITMNSSISALSGDVNLTSANGSITTNSLNNVISAKNIGLTASKGDLGTSLRPIQTAIYNNGTLNANAKNIYINYPYSDISNIVLNATENAYLATSGSQLGGLDSVVNIKANSLELRAENGLIALDSVKNKKIDIEVNELKARANGDISITNKNDLNISSIVSTSQGTISLGSQYGSILVAEGERLNPYNINGGNVVLNATRGHIGTADNSIKIARDGIFIVHAKDDVNLTSSGRIYADLIRSSNGKVNLDADYGIIASKSSDDLVYNIYSATGVDLNSKHGNIENIAINTDGVVNASAGYTDGIASGMSDVNISLISKREIAQEDLDLMSEDERQAALEQYADGLKDMKVGKVQASKNVFIYSEKAILNADNNSSLKGEQIVLSANHGDIGDENSAIKLDANRDVTAYAGNGNSVYLTSDRDLKVNEVRSFNTYNSEPGATTSESVLENVVLTSKGNIINASLDDNKANVSANNVVLNAGNDIGSSIKYFTVETQSADLAQGLNIRDAENAYIKGVNKDLNIVSSNITNDAFISTDENLSVTVQNSEAGGDLTVDSKGNTTLTGDITADNIVLNSQGETKLSNVTTIGNLTNESNSLVTRNAELENLTTNSAIANLANTTVKGDADITTTDTTTINTATIGGDLRVESEGNTTLTGDIIADNIILNSQGETKLSNVTTTGNLTNDSKSLVTENAELENLTTNSEIANLANTTVRGDADITTTDTTTIKTAAIEGNFNNNSTNTVVTDNLAVSGDANITADESIKIADADLESDLNLTAKDITIDEMNLSGNINAKTDNINITSSNDVNIGNISGITNAYTEEVNISGKSIYNGRDDNGVNIYGKNIDLQASVNIGSADKPLNIMLTDENKLAMSAKESASVYTSGASANYSKLQADALTIFTHEDINVDYMNVNNLNIKTTADNLSINNMEIGKKGTLDVGNKHIVIDNTSLSPILDADVQMYLSKTPAWLKVNRSDNVLTDAVNVTRQNEYILINNDGKYSSMNSAITSNGASAVKNTNVGEKTIEKTDNLIYKIPTIALYKNIYAEIKPAKGLIMNQIEEVVTPENAFDVINITLQNPDMEQKRLQKTSKKENNRVSVL